VRGSQPLMRSLASCGGPFTERLSCGVLLAIFRTPEALPGRVDGECSPAGPPPLHQSGGSHDGADAKSSSSTPQSPQKNANHALVGPECIIISRGRCFEANGSETLRRLFYGGYLKLSSATATDRSWTLRAPGPYGNYHEIRFHVATQAKAETECDFHMYRGLQAYLLLLVAPPEHRRRHVREGACVLCNFRRPVIIISGFSAGCPSRLTRNRELVAAPA